MHGYHGGTLVIDLATHEVRREPIAEQVLRRFIGGTGLGTYLLYKHCPPRIDPLAPANPLVFVTSPLVGSRAHDLQQVRRAGQVAPDRLHRRLALVQLPGDRAQEDRL